MSLIILVSCDSDPAPYAGGESWRCRAYLPVATTDPMLALVAAIRAGWTYSLAVVGPGQYPAVLTCPACNRANAALAGAST